MFNEQLLKLFTTIKTASTQNLLNWKRGGAFTYETEPYDNQIIHIEKYFYGKEQASCINLTVFNNNKTSILTETVRCQDSIYDQEFLLLDEIYNTVDIEHQKKETEQFSPVLMHLTQSLEEKLTSH